MPDKSQYMKQWRNSNPSARSRQVRAARARARALKALADKFPHEFAILINAYRKEENLPPLTR